MRVGKVTGVFERKPATAAAVPVARLCIAICALVLGLASCTTTSTAVTSGFLPSPTPPQPWLLVSDVHFTPFDDPSLVARLARSPVSGWRAILTLSARPPSPYFSDTNFALLESVLAAMRATLPNPRVVIIPGDFMAHNFPDQFAKYFPGAEPADYQRFVDKTIAFLAAEFDAAFPRAQFLITIGNNDGYCGNYMSTPGSPFLAHMAAAWGPLVNRNGTAPNFASEFSAGGYYTATLPAQRPIPAIALNSVYWSARYKNGCGTQPDPGATELNWLAATLRTNGRALLMTHIPPGIDEYASLNAGAATPLYGERYTLRLMALLATQGVNPRALVLGHIHHATFEIAQTGGGPLGSIGVPSISPQQGNNPAFVVAQVGSTGPTIVDTTTYVLPLAAQSMWRNLYSFDADYGLEAYDAPNLLRLDAAIAADPSVRARFFVNYNSASDTATPQPAKWPWYWCGHTNLTSQPYAACVQRTDPSAKRRRHARTATGTNSTSPASSVMRAVHEPVATGRTE